MSSDKAETTPPPPLFGDDKFYCKLCGIYATCEQNLQMHLRGKKHKKKLKASGVVIPEAPLVCVPAGGAATVISDGKESVASTTAASLGKAPTEWNSGWETIGDNATEDCFSSSASEWGVLGMSLAAMQKKQKKKKKKKSKKHKFSLQESFPETILGGGLDSSAAAKAKRAARFAASANLPPPKKKCMAWSDGTITSNKSDALLKFLSRKTQATGANAGKVKTRPSVINADAVAVALRLSGKRAFAKIDDPLL